MDTIYVGTNGCQDAQLSSKRVQRFFIANQRSLTDDPRHATCIIFYACGLTKEKEDQSLQVIHDLISKKKPDAELIVWGCLPRQNPAALAEVYDGALVGPRDDDFFDRFGGEISIHQISHAAAADDMATLAPATYHGCARADPLTAVIFRGKQGIELLHSRYQYDSSIFYIPVATGCTGHCTYCSERPVFGPIRSRPLEAIRDEFQEGLEKGYNRFSLIATDLGAYGMDRGLCLPDLLQAMIDAAGAAAFKITLNQVEPHNLLLIYPQMKAIFKTGRIDSLMSPVQSGSDRILKLMGRKYSAEAWRDLMLEINSKYPHIRLSTQFLVGFPTETDADFQATLNLLMPPLRLDDLFIFQFSPRPGIPALKLNGTVDKQVKEARAAALLRRFAYRYARNSLRFRSR
ncbi:MAG: radical SAM protein [Methanomicrobiales archaeon]|nr:radical SAM protein [Methanomicrobiales archaeon]